MAGKIVTQTAGATDEAWALVPDSCRDLADPQRDLPRIARDPALMAQIESAVRSVPTRHDLHLGDALRIDPDFAYAHNNLGAAPADKGQLNAAIEHYTAISPMTCCGFVCSWTKQPSSCC